MSLDLGKVSMLLLSLLLLLSITGSAGGGISSAFGQNTFSGNITTSDIIGLAENIAERVQEEVDDDTNLPIFSDDEENSSGIDDSIDDSSSSINYSNSNSSPTTVTIPSLPSSIITTTPSTPPNIMINEIGLNPTGEDDEGEEWIELYNPSDADINLSNYEMSTSSGDVTIMLPTDAVVGAGETYVMELEEDENYLSNIVENLILTTTDTTTTTAAGDDSIVVDITPSLVDMSNDERTWQRIPDGKNEWRFVEETEGELNNPNNHNINSVNNNSQIVSQVYDAIEHYYYSESDAQCIGYAGCIEGITSRIADGDTLYVTANNNNSSGNTIYRVDLALIEVLSSMEEEKEEQRIDSTAFTRELCLGSNTLIDQDDKHSTTSLADSSSITAVVYCSSTNLNKELLDQGYTVLDMQQCATSEFANESWAKDHGC